VEKHDKTNHEHKLVQPEVLTPKAKRKQPEVDKQHKRNHELVHQSVHRRPLHELMHEVKKHNKPEHDVLHQNPDHKILQNKTDHDVLHNLKPELVAFGLKQSQHIQAVLLGSKFEPVRSAPRTCEDSASLHQPWLTMPCAEPDLASRLFIWF
jgi:hypothetical protein